MKSKRNALDPLQSHMKPRQSCVHVRKMGFAIILHTLLLPQTELYPLSTRGSSHSLPDSLGSCSFGRHFKVDPKHALCLCLCLSVCCPIPLLFIVHSSGVLRVPNGSVSRSGVCSDSSALKWHFLIASFHGERGEHNLPHSERSRIPFMIAKAHDLVTSPKASFTNFIA